MKIALVGEMCAGKTTLSKYIINWYNTKYKLVLNKTSFAEKIYKLAYELFGMKEKDRKLLQDIGTKFREIDNSVWINYTVNKYNDNVIIDDCRYLNEIKRLHDEGFVIIKINITKELQLTRLKNLYTNTWEKHFANMTHSSEISISKIDKKYYHIEVTAGDTNMLETITMFLESRIII